MIDKSQIYKWWSLFKNEHELVEVRVLGKKTYSGYFKDIEVLIKSIERLDNDPDEQIYFTLNCINDNCYGRNQSERMEMNPKNTTKDNDVIGRKFVLVDLDPKRSTGVNSSGEELEYAHKKALEVYHYLKGNGFNEMIVCMSGNGYHLNIPCAISMNPANDNLIRRFLLSLSMMFSDDNVDVDEKVFNPSRICKLYGTTAKKGANIPSRPYRISVILKAPDVIVPNDIEYFKKVAELYPEDELKPSQDNNFSREKFDLISFFNKHGIIYKTQSVADGTKYMFDHCFFNEEHRGKDAVIFQRSNGAISYVCQHNSCSHYKWKDVRLKFEPDAYDKKDYQEFQHKQKYYGASSQKPFERQKETQDKGKKWLSLKDVKNVSVSDLEYIPTGFFALDRAMKGLILGEVTLLSGLNGSGKSSWLNILMLNSIQRGFKVACWSGELTAPRLKDWLYQSAAGKNYTTKESPTSNLYETDKKVIPKIDNWVDGKFFLFNNNYGCNWEQILLDVKDIIKTDDVKLIVIDNLMALSIDSKDGSSLEKQKLFIIDVCNIAKDNNVHVILVAHPRKENSLLRKESISGTADLTNAVNNCILIHRVGEDFSKRAGEFFGKAKAESYMGYSNVVELCKNRSFGIVDYLVGMYYECESKRFKNSISEHIAYGWQDPPIQQPLITIPPMEYHPDHTHEPETRDDMPFGPAIDGSPF